MSLEYQLNLTAGWRKVSLGIFVAACAAGIAGAAPQARPADAAAVRAVAEGKQTEAKASWWGFDPADATSALQAAINSGARRLIVEDLGSPWNVDKLELASNQEIVFEKGVVVQAKRGSFHGKSDCLFTATCKTNITLTGKGATLKMWKADYQSAEYSKSEWRHLISLKSCVNITITGLTLADSGGDGIYLGSGHRGQSNCHIVIRDVVCVNNHRQGISVITADDLLMERVALLDTGGTNPQAGIDFEPNNPEERLVNCVMRDCRAENNVGCAYDFYLKQLHKETAPISIRLERCSSKGCREGVNFYTGNNEPDTVGGSIEFIDCNFDAPKGTVVNIRQKPVAGCKMVFSNCVFTMAADSPDKNVPIAFSSVMGARRDVGGVAFANCTINDPVARAPMRFTDASGGLRLGEITGTLKVVNHGKTVTQVLNEALLESWVPSQKLKRFAAVPVKFAQVAPVKPEAAAKWSAPARMRDRASWLVFAKAGAEVSLTIKQQAVGKQEVKPAKVSCLSPAGKAMKTKVTGEAGARQVTFTAEETGAYQVVCEPGKGTASVASANAPVAAYGGGVPFHFCSSTGDVYFWVPAGTRSFAVQIAGGGGTERVKAALFDPAGKQVREEDNIESANQMLVETPANYAGGVWHLKTARPSQGVLEDYFVDLQGIAPLLSASPEAVLKAD